MKTSISIACTITSCILLSSCSVKTQLDEMHDSTVGMSHTTAEMSETTKDLAILTEGMSYTTDELNEMTAALLPLARTGGTAEIRNARVESMNNPIYKLNIEHKILHAGIYWQGFEFQAWSNTVVDDEFTKNNFYADAVEEFCLTLDSNFSAAGIDVKDLSKINPATKKGAELNILAFAVSADKVLMYQDYLARHIPTFKKVSFLDIIKNALLKEKAYSNGEILESELERFEHLTLRNAKKLKYFLHVRYNMLTTIALARINGLDQAGLAVQARYLLKSWNAKLYKKTRAEKEEIVEYLEMANVTKDFMTSLGEVTVVNKNINKILRNMKVNTNSSKYCKKQCVDNKRKIKLLAKSMLN